MLAGFTIIELLVVIVVIAVLGTIAIASSNSVQIRAKDVYIRNDIKNVAAALENYRADNGYLPQSTAVLNTTLSPVYLKMYQTQNPSGITNISDFSGKIYKVVPSPGNPAAADFNIVAAIERSSDTYVIIANSSFSGVYFMDKDKQISVGTIDWSSSAVTLLQTNAGLASPVSYYRYTL